MDIKGEWIGFYKFGEGYSEKNKQLMVPFLMKIEEGISEFIGIIQEDITNGGIDDGIIVRGKIENDTIKFVKFYKNVHYIDENNEKQEFESDTLSKVYYTGKFNFDERKFIGDWFIKDSYIDENEILQDTFTSGVWELWKK